MNCEPCRRINLDDLLKEQGYEKLQVLHHSNFASLEESARKGCRSCYHIERAICRDRVDLLDHGGKRIRRFDGIHAPDLSSDWKDCQIVLETVTWGHSMNLHFKIMGGKVDVSEILIKYRFGDFRVFIRRSAEELDSSVW